MLVFDGDCSFCSTYAGWVARRLPSEAEVVAWQQVRDLAGLGLTPDDVDCAAWWLDATGSWAGGEAIARSLVAAGGVWRLAGSLMLLGPVRPLARTVYAWVARNRHRLPGGTPACGLEGDTK